MYIDLICFDSKEKLGFTNMLKVSVINANHGQELDKKIAKSKEKINVVDGSSLNRFVFENKRVDIIVNPEMNRKEDSLHYRNSGLNQVLCKLAHKNKIGIGFNFNNVLKSKSAERAKIIGRMSQNVRLCRKYDVAMVIGSFATTRHELKNPSDMISFGIIIGMTPKEAKESLMNANCILEEKRNSISEGIKLIE